MNFRIFGALSMKPSRQNENVFEINLTVFAWLLRKRSLLHLFQRYWLRNIVVLVAIPAIQIASPHRNDVHQNGMFRRSQRFRDHLQLAHTRPTESRTPRSQYFRASLYSFCLYWHEFRKFPKASIIHNAALRTLPASWLAPAMFPIAQLRDHSSHLS